MTTFNEFVASKALQARLPFPIDFELLSVDSDVTTKIGKYELATIEELTVLESWFFELIEEHNVVKAREFSLLVNQLAEKLKLTMGLDCSREDAAKYLAVAKPEWADDEKYLKFSTNNAKELAEFNSLYRQTQSSYISDMMMITLSMILRYDPNWTVGKTASLGRKSLQKIKDFLITEARGGQVEDAVVVEPKSEVEEEAKN